MIKLRLFGQKRLKLDVDGRIIGLINSKLTFSQSSRLSLKSSWHPHPNSLDQRGWMAAKPGCVQLRQGRQLHRADHVPGASQPVPFDSWALSDQYGPDQCLCHHPLPLRWANRAPNVPPERFAGTRTNSASSHKNVEDINAKMINDAIQRSYQLQPLIVISHLLLIGISFQQLTKIL